MGETGNVEDVNQDLGPETQLMDGTQDPRPGTLKVEPETSYPRPLLYMTLKGGTWDPYDG